MTQTGAVRSHQKRYLVEVLPAMALIAVWGAFAWSGERWPPALLALLPPAAIAWTFVAMWRRLMRKDELEQRIELIAIAAASAAVGLGSFAWSLLESANAVPRGSLVYVLPALIAIYGVLKLLLRWRYR